MKKKAMPKTYEGKSTKPGGGGRFAMVEDALMRKGKTKEEADAIAAAMGRKKYGAKKMAEYAAKGRKRNA